MALNGVLRSCESVQELVLDAGGALRRHARASLRLQDLLAVQPRFFGGLRALVFGHVAGQLREPDQLAGIVAQRRDRDTGPEGRAVLAHPPSLVQETARRLGHPQLVGGPARLPRLRRVEDRKVLADDFLGRVALDSLGADVPGDHHAIRIEHEDRVLAHAFDQQPEPLLAAAQ
jgi:hypothetical protein